MARPCRALGAAGPVWAPPRAQKQRGSGGSHPASRAASRVAANLPPPLLLLRSANIASLLPLQLIIFVGLCFGWVGSYLFRVATKVGNVGKQQRVLTTGAQFLLVLLLLE